MGAKLSKKKNNEEFAEEMDIPKWMADKMTRLKSASDLLCKECMRDVKHLASAAYEETCSQSKKEKTVGDLLATLGVTKLFLEVWQKYFEMDFLKDAVSKMYVLMHGILWMLCFSMETSTALCVQVFESDLHKDVLNYLKTDYLDPSKTVDLHCDEVVFGLLAVLYNMIKNVPESSQSLREQKAFDVFQRFRRSPSNNIVCLTLILQGYIITDEENELVNSDDSNFIFLKHVLERALMPNNHRRRADGFASFEVIAALNRLAANDKNKTRIVDVGLLPFYVMLLQPECSEDEQEAAAEGLCTLAFKCSHEIENEPGCVADFNQFLFCVERVPKSPGYLATVGSMLECNIALKKLTEENSERLKSRAAGALLTLEELQRKENPCRQVSRSGSRTSLELS